MTNSEFVFGRHSLKPEAATEQSTGSPESEQYPGISEAGVELAKSSTAEIIEAIDHMSPNGILFIGGASELIRTKSTSKVQVGTLDRHYENDPATKVYTRADIEDIREQAKSTKKGKALEMITALINTQSDKKLIIDYPLFVKEFSLIPEFVDPASKKSLTHYAKAIFNAGEGSEEKAANVFMRSEGGISADGETMYGASPQEIAERHIQGIKRLQDFAALIAPERQVVTYIVGHAWNLDALAAYLANNGKANAEGWEKTGSTMIDKTEMGKVTIQDGKTVFAYRGKEYNVPLEAL